MASGAYDRGIELLQRLGGTERPVVLDLFPGATADFGRLSIEFVYGHVYHRPGLTLRQRQFTTIGALTPLGFAAPQLRFHLGAALNIGCTREQVIESIIQVSPYAGFPATRGALAVARKVFEERPDEPGGAPTPTPSPSDRYERGLAAVRKIDGAAGEKVIASLAEIAPDLVRYIVEFVVGEIYQRPGLDLSTREIVTVAACTAMGTALPQLKVHIHGLLNVGGTREEVMETILHTCVYAGFPAARGAIAVAKDVFGER